MPKKNQQCIIVVYAGREMPVSVEFDNRKQLSISVHPNGSVTAIAPMGKSLSEVAAFLSKRRSWIARQKRHFEQYQPSPEKKRYISGETHMYLGRQYRLKVYRARNAEVRLVGKFINIFTPTPKNSSAIAKALIAWYQTHAVPIFKDRLSRCLKTALFLKSNDLEIRVRTMSNRWGSCSKKGKITLNLDLIKAPLHCIEYVIMHELCHLQIHNHSPAFFRLLGRHMPEWKKRKERLDSVVLN